MEHRETERQRATVRTCRVFARRIANHCRARDRSPRIHKRRCECAATGSSDTPMGGVKHSGYGYLGGHEGLDLFLVGKLISHGA